MTERYDFPGDERLRAGDLIAAVAGFAPKIGGNTCEWPGLIFYRFEAPTPPQWDDVRSLALCFVVQGRKRVTTESGTYYYDPFNYFVMSRGMRFEAEVLVASVAQPFLSFVLQVDPAIVHQVLADMNARSAALFQKRVPPARAAAYVSAFDLNLMGAVLRFVSSLSTEQDRRVLSPIYLQEIVYRVLQTAQCARLTAAAERESKTNPISAAIAYMREDLTRPLSVADLADAVSMSQSAFAHLFKTATGVSPYQFVKRLRLDHARVLLVQEGRSVSETAATVGYTSLSHFINEFKRNFGVTPGAYAEFQRANVPLAVSEMTSAASN
ncbi:MAG TPA: AraC family transcriptional regulator [Acidimicrobiales bacterium]|jgi:AraC-like DNA-binding protein|nr:AraC family transcriptional regulator [Acidimicrobiales bacterium]